MNSTYHPDWILPFAVIIPTWNNLAYLQLCVRSLCENSICEPEIIIHVNDGSDGTLAWVKKQNLPHTHSPINIGIARAVNRAAALATNPYLVYFNDDMYALPGWDERLSHFIHALNTDCFMASATMIEPEDTGNRCVVVANYGTTLQTFREKQLLQDQPHLVRPHWRGSMFPPVVVPWWLWQEVGGMSIEYPGGFYTDPDLAMKAWQAGCRQFAGVGDSLVYHFSQKTTARLPCSVVRRAHRLFKAKWGISARKFKKEWLRLGEPFNN